MPIQSGQRLTPARLLRRAVRARRSTTQSISSGTISAISFDTEDYDNASMFSPTSTLITLPVAGFYGFTGYGGLASNATGYRRLLVDANSSGSFFSIDQRPAVSGDSTHVTISGTYLATANDTLRLHVDQNSGGALNLLANATFEVWLIEAT